MSAPASVYPRTVEDLLPQARLLAAELGEIPSRNRLMSEFRVGAPKAAELREALSLPTNPGPAEPPPGPAADTGPGMDAVGPVGDSAEPAEAAALVPLVGVDGHPGVNITTTARTVSAGRVRGPVTWPVLLLSLPAFVAIWSGWVGLGELAGFGVVHPLPGIADDIAVNTAITLPIGVETYAAYALWVWLSGRAPRSARRFAKWSALGSLVFGAAGQIAYHLMAAAGLTEAPWQITSAVACLPVAVLGMGAALAHLLHNDETEDDR